MTEDRSLRETFERAAHSYSGSRPEYPDELYADLLEITGLTPPAALLEVGPGPGIATEPLARRGFTITAVELGADLAAEARRALADYPDVTVVRSAFEDAQLPGGFDLVYAATAWHWVDRDAKYRLAAERLRPSGHLAVWGAGHAFPADVDPFFTEIQPVYEEIGERHDGPWPGPPPEEQPNRVPGEMVASGLFEPVGERRYVWSRRYTADEYLALLDTFSGHIAMAPDARTYLYTEIRRRLDARPDRSLTRHWLSILTVGRLHPRSDD